MSHLVRAAERARGGRGFVPQIWDLGVPRWSLGKTIKSAGNFGRHAVGICEQQFEQLGPMLRSSYRAGALSVGVVVCCGMQWYRVDDRKCTYASWREYITVVPNGLTSVAEFISREGVTLKL